MHTNLFTAIVESEQCIFVSNPYRTCFFQETFGYRFPCTSHSSLASSPSFTVTCASNARTLGLTATVHIDIIRITMNCNDESSGPRTYRVCCKERRPVRRLSWQTYSPASESHDVDISKRLNPPESDNSSFKDYFLGKKYL